ncbi:unnamed protein product, partial [Arctogadus glacialis]
VKFLGWRCWQLVTSSLTKLFLIGSSTAECHITLESNVTKPKASGECPICGNILKFVAKHLREIHSLKNVQERGILNLLATGRTLVPAGPCPLPFCSPHVLNVVKHIRTHTEVRKLTVDREIRALKLAALRATDPHPPMASTLDLPEDQAQQSDPEAGVSMCKKRTCVNARLRVRDLESELADLRTRLVQLQAKRRPRQAAPAPAPIPARPEEEEANAPNAAATL